MTPFIPFLTSRCAVILMKPKTQRKLKIILFFYIGTIFSIDISVKFYINIVFFIPPYGCCRNIFIELFVIH